MEIAHYDQLAALEEKHWWHLARQRIIIDFLKRNIAQAGFNRHAKLLDVGCGTGKMLKLLARVADPVGVDFSKEAIAYCRRKKAGKAILAEGTRLPFKKESFEIVTAMEVLEHINNEAKALREWRRVLKPGGMLFLTCPAYMWMWGPADKFAHHYRRYTKQSLTHVVESAGFEIVRASYFNTLLFPGVALIRLIRKPFVRIDAMSEADLERAFDFHIGPEWLNGFLRWTFSLETYLLRLGTLPFGVSLIVLARKRS